MVHFILQYIDSIPQELAVLLLSLLPIIELRGSLPVALGVYQMPFLKAYLLVILGNIVPGVLILYCWDWFIQIVEKYWPWLRAVLQRIEEKTEGKWNKKIEKYGPLALIIFVAIPLPGTGVWTGALAAWIFHLSKNKALVSLFIGVLISGLLVGSLTIGGLKLF